MVRMEGSDCNWMGACVKDAGRRLNAVKKGSIDVEEVDMMGLGSTGRAQISENLRRQ